MKTKLLYLAFILAMSGGSLHAPTNVPIIGGVAAADVGQSSKFKITVNAAAQLVLTSSTTPAPYGGQTITVIFTENATGGFAVTFASNISNPCAVTTTANATTVCQFTYDSSSNTWNGVGSSSSTGAGGSYGVGTITPSQWLVTYGLKPGVVVPDTTTVSGSNTHSGTETFANIDAIQFVDGVTNATVQQAINKLPSPGGGTVYVPCGSDGNA